MKRTFSLKAILTVVTEYAFVDRQYLTEMLEFITNTEGEGLEASPRGLIFAADSCIPMLMDQLPFLSDLDINSLNEENADEWVQAAIGKYGEFHLVEQMKEPLFKSPDDALFKAIRYFSKH